MLCNLAVRRRREDGPVSFTLRVTGRTALGPSGTGGRDSRDFPTASDLLHGLEGLGVSREVMVAALGALEDPGSRHTFIEIAKDVQIAFETLEKAGIYLFDVFDERAR